MTRNVININAYRYLVEYYDANIDLKNNQYLAEFVMLRNFTILNNIIYDNDIYIIERKYFEEYVNELISSNKPYGNIIAFPITNTTLASYSNTYRKFNDSYNVWGEDNNINSSICNLDGSFSNNVYTLYSFDNDHKLKNAKIKCDKIRLYHPLIKNNINAIIDITNFINGINFHYLCRPLNTYKSNSLTEISYGNNKYSEFIDIYFPNISELFKIDENGNYSVFYKEDFNIFASTQNEKFMNSIMSNYSDVEHSEKIDGTQIIPLNLLIQPYRIIEEYAADSEFNYNDTVADDEKIFVRLYLKNNFITSSTTNNFNIILYPYKSIDESTNIYLLNNYLSPGYLSLSYNNKFKLMSRIGFSDGIISIVTLFDYPNKAYFIDLANRINNEHELGYRDDVTSPVKEAYKFYNHIDDHYYNLFINEDVERELQDIDAVESLSPEIIQAVKEIENFNSSDKTEILNRWKRIMKETILQEYENEFGTPTNFLGFKIQIASDPTFKNIIYEKNERINFNDIDDFSFKINNIFEGWNQRPEELMAKISFYDRILGIELVSNLVIITKEWFKYLVNDPNIYRLTNLSLINKSTDNINMNVTKLDITEEKNDLIEIKERLEELGENDLSDKLADIIDKLDNNINKNKINFINSIKCIVNRDERNSIAINKNTSQKIIFKPIFYKVKDLQNISINPGVVQNIGINLSEYLSKIESFKIVIENTEYIETGRNNIFVIFKVNANNIKGNSGVYNLIDNNGNFISSGNWNKISV